MTVRKYKVGEAFTLVELMVTILAVVVLIIGISTMLAHGHLGYRRLYRRVNSEIVRNAHEARRTFERIVRKSSAERHDPDDPENSLPTNELCVYYYSDPLNPLLTVPNRYARFYLQNNSEWADTELMLDEGPVDFAALPAPGSAMPPLPAPERTIVLAHYVTVPASSIFSTQGQSVRMVLTLDNQTLGIFNKIESLRMTVTTTAIRHNH